LVFFLADGKASHKTLEQSRKKYVEFGLFGGVTTALAGSLSFLVGREHIQVKHRYHLFIFTFFSTFWSFVNDLLLTFLNFGLISNSPGKFENVSSVSLFDHSSLGNFNNSHGYSSDLSAAEKVGLEQRYQFNLVLFSVFFFVTILLASSTVLVSYNLMVGRETYLEVTAAVSAKNKNPSQGAAGSISSNMDNLKEKVWQKNSFFDVKAHSVPTHTSIKP
jgi:hypothetical protein